MHSENFYGKRGLSPVVATIAIVMVTIAAASFIAGIVVPLVKNQLNEGTECIGYEDYFQFYEEFEYNCYRKVNGNYLYALSVKAGSVSDEKLENIKGLRVQFLGEGESEGVEIVGGEDASQNIRMLNSDTEFLEVPGNGEVRTYVYTSDVNFRSVEIYPVLKSNRLCERTDILRIEGFVCNQNLGL